MKKYEPNSDAESEFISTLANGWVWLGITDEKEENNFVDINGSKLSWKNWADNEPNNNEGNEGWFVFYKRFFIEFTKLHMPWAVNRQQTI